MDHDTPMGDADEYENLSPAYDQIPSTPRFPGIPGSLSGASGPASPWYGSRSNGKRPAEEDLNSVYNSVPMAPPKPVARIVAPNVVGRLVHRRQNVATAAWGLDAPGIPVPTAFNVFKAILRHPNLFFQFTIRLPLQSMIDLYAIDKEFHYRFNIYNTSIIHDHALYYAPEAAYVFSSHFYPDLLITDPMLRPMDGRPHLARDVPSLRWTAMVMYRDNVVRTILTLLGVNGHRVPQGAQMTIMKFWLLMEQNTNRMRNAMIADRKIWSDQDIYYFHLFLMKLDMQFNHPVTGNGFTELSHMLLTQKSLTTLYNVLRRRFKMDYDDATDMLVKTYAEEDLNTDEHPWLADETENGVPLEETGLMRREGWHMNGDFMESPVDLVSIESIRRGLDVQLHLIDFMTYGYIDPETNQNIPTPRQWRRETKVSEPKEPWPTPTVLQSTLTKIDKMFGIEKPKEKEKPQPAPRKVYGPYSTRWDN